MSPRKGILWFRNDLRLHDNEALLEALNHCEEIIPVYVFDTRLWNGKSSFGFPKMGEHRAQFTIESVLDLKKSLQQKGSDLIIRVGITEDEIFKIARKEKTSWVYCNRERTREEVDVQDALEAKLWTVGQEVRFTRGKMLLYTSDLPFPVTQTPDIFTQFRKEVEKIVPVRPPLSTENMTIPPLNVESEIGEIPSLAQFGINDPVKDPRSAFPYKGGETAALQHLEEYFWDKKLAESYKETRNELLGTDFSTKFSPWLANGCLSPKKIYQELSNFENKVKKNDSTYWIYFELLWRDFFRLMGKKHGDKIFLLEGPKAQENPDWEVNFAAFNQWAHGKTGIPFIDANMRELNLTGFMSNRGRQNVASFLVHDLGLNWKMGAEYFEYKLLDYDPCSNWCNWNYIAGVGSDPRENRVFNIAGQASKYDPDGTYVKTWLPELKALPEDKIHHPETLSAFEMEEYGVRLDVDYPSPMLDYH
ncbi:MAG: DASH family cryptochrome [Saprospiraceae bacterium]